MAEPHHVLSMKEKIILGNLYGMEGPQRASDLAFLAPQPTGRLEWAMPALRNLSLKGLLSEGPRIQRAASFSLTEAGRRATLDQLSAEKIDIVEELDWHDGLICFTGTYLGALRIFSIANHMDPNRFICGTPSADELDDYLRVCTERGQLRKVMSRGPHFHVACVGDDTWQLLDEILRPEGLSLHVGNLPDETPDPA